MRRGFAVLAVLVFSAGAFPVQGQEQSSQPGGDDPIEVVSPESATSSSGSPIAASTTKGRSGFAKVSERGQQAARTAQGPVEVREPGGLRRTDGSDPIAPVSPASPDNRRSAGGRTGGLDRGVAVKRNPELRSRDRSAPAGATGTLPGVAGRKLVERGPNFEVVDNGNKTKTAVLAPLGTSSPDPLTGERLSAAPVTPVLDPATQRYRLVAGGLPISIASSSDSAWTDTEGLLTIGAPGRRVRIGLANPVPGISASIRQPANPGQSPYVVLENLFPNADVEWEASTAGLKERIVVRSPLPKSVTELRFRVDLDGVKSRTNAKTQALEFVEPDGSILFVFPQAFAMDSTNSYGSGRATPVPLKLNADGTSLSFSLNQEWMSAPDRAYPVIIDPTTGATAPYEVGLASVLGIGTDSASYGAPSGNVAGSLIPLGGFVTGWNSTYGYYTKNIYQAGVRFDTTPFNRKLIDSARLYSYNADCGHDNVVNPYNGYYGIDAFAIKQQWSSSTIAWSDVASTTDRVSSRQVTGGWTGDWGYSYPAEMVAFVSTVQSWADSPANNFGLALRNSDRGIINYSNTWCNVHTNALYLEVTYHDRPNNLPTMVAVSPADGAALQGGATPFTVTLNDVDGDNLTWWLDVRIGGTRYFNEPRGVFPAGTTTSITLPPGTLPRGSGRWYAWVKDSQSDWILLVDRAFSITDNPPTIALSAPAADATVRGKVQFTVTTGDIDGDTVTSTFTFTNTSTGASFTRVAPPGVNTYTSQPGDFADATTYSWSASATANGVTVQAGVSRNFTYTDKLPVVSALGRSNVNGGPLETDGDAAGSASGRSVSLPFFSASGTDEDGDDVSFDYQICPPAAGGGVPAGYDSIACGPLSIGGQGTAASALIGTLAWNTKYWWRVVPRANGRSGTPTAWRSFVISVSDCNPAVTTYCDLSTYQYGYSPYVGYSSNEADGSGVSGSIGGFTKSESDAAIPGVPGFSLERTYNSGDVREGVFGRGWSSIADVGLQQFTSKNVLVVMPDGRRSLHPFVKGINGSPDSFTNQKGFFDVLEKPSLSIDKVWKLTQKDKTVLWFEGSGRLRSFENRNGHVLTISREPSLGRVASIVDNISGRALTFNYATATSVGPATITLTPVKADVQQTVTTPTWGYDYDTFNGKRFLRKVCNSRNANLTSGHCTSYSYDAAAATPVRTELLHRVVRPEANQDVRVTYDALALGGPRVLERFDGRGNRTAFTYGWDAATSSINQVTIDEAMGWQSIEKYEPGQGRLVEKTVAPGGVSTTTKWHYNAGGFIDEVKRGSGATWETSTTTTDERGNPLDVTDARGKTTRYRYSAPSPSNKASDQPIAKFQHGLADTAADGTPGKTTYTYDVNGNLTIESHAVAAGVVLQTRTAYTTGAEAAVGGGTMPAFLIRTKTTVGGQITTHNYDAKGNLREVIGPSGSKSTFDVDELGRTVARTEVSAAFPAGVRTEFTLDVIGNLLVELGPEVTNQVSLLKHRMKTEHSYDTNNRLKQSAVSDVGGSIKPDPARTTLYDYDANDQLFKITDSKQGVLWRSFDANNNILTVTDQNGKTIRSEYTAGNVANKVTVESYTNRPGATARNIVTSEITAFDIYGRPKTLKDAKGRTRTKEYWPGGLVKTVTLDSYRFNNGTVVDTDDTTGPLVLESYTYDDDGNVNGISLADGRRQSTMVFDRGGRVTSARELVAANVYRTVTNQYLESTAPMQASVQTTTLDGESLSSVVSTKFDLVGRVVQVETANGTTPIRQRFGYDDRDNQNVTIAADVADTDPVADSKKTTVSFDQYNRPWKVVRPVSNVVTFSAQTPAAVAPTSFVGYDTFGSVSETKDANGSVTASEFDALGRLVKRTFPTYTPVAGTPSTAAITPVETFAYDGVGNMTSRVDRRGQTLVFAFDSLNRPAATTYPAADSTSVTVESSVLYDDTGQVVQTTDRTGATVGRTFDELDRLKTQTVNVRAATGVTAGSYTTSFLYYPSSELLAVTDPTLKSKLFQVDSVGRRVSSTDELGKLTTYTYNRLDALRVTTDPLGRKSEIEYDQAGRKSAVVLRGADGVEYGRTAFTLDGVGNETKVTYKRGGVVDRVFDLNSRLISVSNPNDSTPNTFTYGYDAVGNRTRILDGKAGVTWTTYNPWNLADKTVEPTTTATPLEADRTYSTVYDGGGLSGYDLLPGGVLISRTFDARGRLRSETGAGTVGAVSATRAFDYDAEGRLKSISHPGGSITASYDDRGLLAGVTSPSGNSSFTYNSRGLMDSRNDGAGASSFTWTARSELDGVTAPFGGPLKFTWSDGGDLSSIVQGATTRTYGYDPVGRLSSDVLTKTTGGTVLAKQEYTYDADGNVNKQTVSLGTNAGNGVHKYGYNFAGQLTSWQKDAGAVVTYAYDGNGNRTSGGGLTYEFDGRNRLTTVSDGTAYSWSPRGTLAKTVKGAVTTNFVFDGLGRQTNAGSVAFSYDGLDRVVSRAGSTTFRYAGLESDPVDVGTQLFGRSPYGDVYAAKVGSSGAAFGVGTNRHGDVTHTFNAGTAVYSGSRVFDPWGVPAGASGTVLPLGFQGDWTDPTSGDVNAAARWYRPGVGGFLSRDTYSGVLGSSVSLNRFTYGANSPLRFWDPTGFRYDEPSSGFVKSKGVPVRPVSVPPTHTPSPSVNVGAVGVAGVTAIAGVGAAAVATVVSVGSGSGVAVVPASGVQVPALKANTAAAKPVSKKVDGILCNPKKGVVSLLMCPGSNPQTASPSRSSQKSDPVPDLEKAPVPAGREAQSPGAVQRTEFRAPPVDAPPGGLKIGAGLAAAGGLGIAVAIAAGGGGGGGKPPTKTKLDMDDNDPDGPGPSDDEDKPGVINTGNNKIYTSVDANGDIQYIGRTNDLARRAGEHLRSKGIQIDGVKGLDNLSLADAKAVEQVLIEANGGPGGGQLLNKINSIAKSNPDYGAAIKRGCTILSTVGKSSMGAGVC